MLITKINGVLIFIEVYAIIMSHSCDKAQIGFIVLSNEFFGVLYWMQMRKIYFFVDFPCVEAKSALNDINDIGMGVDSISLVVV